MDNYEQIKELLFNKIDEMINKLYEVNNTLVTKDLYSFDDIVSMPMDKLSEISGKINVEDASDSISNKMRNRYGQDFGENFGKDTNLSINQLDMLTMEIYNYYRNIINKKVEEDNEKIRALKSKTKSSIKKMKDLITVLKQTTVDMEKANKLIEEFIISDELKQELIDDIKVYSDLKNKKYEEKKKLEEEKEKIEEALKKIEKELEIEDNRLFKINNYEFIEKTVDEYENIFSNTLFKLDIEEIFTDNEDLKTILKMHYSDLDEETFDAAFISLLSKIDKSNNNETIKLYVDVLNELCKKYELINLVNYTDKEIRSLFGYKNITEDETTKLMLLQDCFRDVKENYNYNDKEVYEIINSINDKIHDIKSDRIDDKLNETDKIKIKSFILFDYKINEYQEKVPYVLKDLNENSTKSHIDKSLDRSKINTNGYKDFNSLIDELIINGKPGILESKNDKLNKLIRPVYYTNGSHDYIKSTMVNSTGMYRIRPNMTSYLRFVDEKITIDNKSSNFDKVVDLLESKLKNVQIDRNNSFNIYINYLDAFKLDDVDSYRTSIKRQDRSRLRELLKKDNLTYDDLKELSEAIDITINAYSKLKEINNSFNFKTIDRITNGSTYTL